MWDEENQQHTLFSSLFSDGIRANTLRTHSDSSVPSSFVNPIRMQRSPSEPSPLQSKLIPTHSIANDMSSSSIGFVKKLWKLGSFSLNDENPKETFFCNICLENCSKRLSFVSSSCCEKHEYCLPCMQGYSKVQMDDGVIEHTCPGMGICGGVLTKDELRTLLTDESFARYERLKQVKTNVNFRECPQCSTGMTALVAADGTTPVTAELTCQSCGCKFCFFHANAHPGLTCQAYSSRLTSRAKQQLRASEALVGRITKSCPQCHAATEKNGGCNHM
jgi:hypothetical protein